MVSHTEVLLLGLLFVFIALNGLFVAAEYSLIRLRRSRVSEMVQQKIIGARTIDALQQSMERSVAGAQLGITISGLSVGGVGQEPIRECLQWLVNTVAQYLPWLDALHVPAFVGIFFSFLLLTMVHVIIGEQLPKLLALHNPEKVALRLAVPFFVFCRSTAFLLGIINGVTSLALRLFGIGKHQKTSDGSPSIDELQILIEDSRKAGKLAADETNLLSRVLELRGVSVRDVMMPLSLVDGINEEMPLVDALEIISQTRHSRLPIFRGGRQAVVGILNSRELLDLFRKKLRVDLKISRSNTPAVNGREPIGKLTAFIRKPFFVSEAMLASDLLAEFAKQRLQLAIVLDSEKPSEVVGLITQEDLLEQLVGEIVDEWDKPIDGVEILEGVNCYRVDGELTLYELRKVLDIRLTSETDNFTVGAVVRDNLLKARNMTYLPEPVKVGDCVDLLDYRFTIETMDGEHVKNLDVRPAPPVPVTADGDSDRADRPSQNS
ncbi:MAG: hemolysin family protein [Cyanobacteria bacterium REEB67]|nr:hemolysin family protein [Cyanobacteria bacterium REEB67]